MDQLSVSPRPRIGIVIGTTRHGRFGETPARWLLDLASRRPDLAFELVDLRDHPLGHYGDGDAVRPDAASRWANRVAALDGYVFVTAEYNHSLPAVLKNALDHTDTQLHRKPAAFIGYGGVGAARAVEHLRLVLIEMHVATLGSAVHIGGATFLAVSNGRPLSAFPHLAEAAHKMLDDLAWWTATLKAGRQRAVPGADSQPLAEPVA
jgi:NAD(P)H-dependent FMN reductase